MGEEMSRQDEKINRLQDHTEKTRDDLANVAYKAKKDFSLKNKSE